MGRGAFSYSAASGIRLSWIPIRGDSMWPALRSGDEAGFTRLEGAPTSGAVVIARIGRALLAHRVLGVDAGGLVRLRGDNSLAEDPRVSLDQLLGEVRRVRRAGHELKGWDVGPKAVGRARVVVKRAVARLLRRAP